MTPTFEDNTKQTRELWEQKRKELHKAMNRSYLVRLFYAIRWKYYSNEIVMGVYDALLIYGPLGGLLLALSIAIYIVQYLKPWL